MRYSRIVPSGFAIAALLLAPLSASAQNPQVRKGFWINGGLGLGSVKLDYAGFGSDSETGTGLLLGLGYDFRVGRNVSLTPFWNGFAVDYDPGDANVGQLGLSLTVH